MSQRFLGFAFFIIFTTLVFGSFDHLAYKQLFSTTVVNNYKSAINTLATNILKPLADAPVPESGEDAQPFLTTFTTKVDQFSQFLKDSKTNADQFRQKLDLEIESLVAIHSAKQQELIGAEQQLQGIDVQIAATDAEIIQAQNQVNRAENDLREAESAVQTAEEKVREARECFGRTKRGWWSKVRDTITKPFKQVLNPLCSVINEGGINNAKDGRQRAQRNRDDNINRLNHLQNVRNQYLTTRTNLEAGRNAIIGQKSQIQTTIGQLQDERNVVMALCEKLKNVVGHLVTLHGRSLILKDTVNKLIDMETLLRPLQTIADQIVAYTSSESNREFFSEAQRSLTESIGQVREKLEQYPLIHVNIGQ